MGLFTDLGYSLLAKERKERFEREGREGENLRFFNRPDLNDPWSDVVPKREPWKSLLICGAIIGGSLLFGLLISYLDHCQTLQ